MVPQAVEAARAQVRKLVAKARGRSAAALAALLWLGFLVAAARPGATAAGNYELAFVDGPLICLALGAACAAATWRRRTEVSERRYWLHLALGFGTWGSVSIANFLVYLGLLGRDDIRMGVELGYALSYVFLVAAIEARPDDLGPAAFAGRKTPPWYAAILVSGLFSTLVLLPQLMNEKDYRVYFSSFGLYAAMDLYIACRALYFAVMTPSRRWRWNFCCLTLAFGLVLVSDLVTFWLRRHHQPLAGGDFLDALWLLPFAFMMLAGASGGMELEDRRRVPPPPTLSEAFAAPPLTWALFFPVFHFVADRLGGLDPQLAGPRDLLVIVFTLMLLLLALHRQRGFEKALAELVRERREITAQLRESEEDLRVLLQRALVAERLRAAEERYAKALGASAVMSEAARPEHARRDLIASLFEFARLPLRLFAFRPGEPGGEPFFANAEARLWKAEEKSLATLETGGWRVVLGPGGKGD